MNTLALVRRGVVFAALGMVVATSGSAPHTAAEDPTDYSAEALASINAQRDAIFASRHCTDASHPRLVNAVMVVNLEGFDLTVVRLVSFDEAYAGASARTLAVLGYCDGEPNEPTSGLATDAGPNERN